MLTSCWLLVWLLVHRSFFPRKFPVIPYSDYRSGIINLCRFSKQHMLLAGLWFDTQKPTMSTFLSPLMISLNDLYLKGITATHYIIIMMYYYNTKITFVCLSVCSYVRGFCRGRLTSTLGCHSEPRSRLEAMESVSEGAPASTLPTCLMEMRGARVKSTLTYVGLHVVGDTVWTRRKDNFCYSWPR